MSGMASSCLYLRLFLFPLCFGPRAIRGGVLSKGGEALGLEFGTYEERHGGRFGKWPVVIMRSPYGIPPQASKEQIGICHFPYFHLWVCVGNGWFRLAGCRMKRSG